MCRNTGAECSRSRHSPCGSTSPGNLRSSYRWDKLLMGCRCRCSSWPATATRQHCFDWHHRLRPSDHGLIESRCWLEVRNHLASPLLLVEEQGEGWTGYRLRSLTPALSGWKRENMLWCRAYGNNRSPVSASSTMMALTGQFSAASKIFSTVSPSGSTASDCRCSLSTKTFGAIVSHMALPTHTL